MPNNSESRPNINVTPLIDILLVLLIIFMAVSPLKPARFETKVPAERKDQIVSPNPYTLVVTVSSNGSLSLNHENELGTVSEPQKLIARLSEVFQSRLENRIYADDLAANDKLSEAEKIQKTVYIKAPRSLPYIEVAKVVDFVKQSGANPIGLQIDDLDYKIY